MLTVRPERPWLGGTPAAGAAAGRVGLVGRGPAGVHRDEAGTVTSGVVDADAAEVFGAAAAAAAEALPITPLLELRAVCLLLPAVPSVR